MTTVLVGYSRGKKCSDYPAGWRNNQTSLWMTQTKTIADAGSTPAGSTILEVALNKHEEKIIDESIKAYKNTIKFLKSQIHELELKKLKAHGENCPECFKFKIASGK